MGLVQVRVQVRVLMPGDRSRSVYIAHQGLEWSNLTMEN
jgi:hypothetical protein